MSAVEPVDSMDEPTVDDSPRPGLRGYSPCMTITRPDVAAPAGTGGYEHGRILVAMARFVGAGFIAYLIISIPGFGTNAAIADDWYTPIAIVLAFGPGLLLLPATFSDAGRRSIPRLAVLCAIGYLAAAGLWFVAWNGAHSTTEPVTWLNAFSGLPSLAVALARIRPAILTLIGCTAVAALITVSGRAPDIQQNPYILEFLWGVLFTLPFMLATRVVVRSGTILDETRADAVRAAADAASLSARNTERARFDALIHDSVIATLVAVKAHPDDQRLRLRPDPHSTNWPMWTGTTVES